MKIKWMIIVGIVILLVILIGIFYLSVISGAIFSFGTNPPKPEITYGEFPFRLTYELNGEIKIIEDTVICEFDGFYSLGSAGKYRKWNLHLSNGKDYVSLLDLSNLDVIDDFNHKVMELYFSPGNAEYYMGDNLGGRSRQAQDFTWIYYNYQNTDGTIGGSGYRADVAWEKHKIRLISWEPSLPIQNTFK